MLSRWIQQDAHIFQEGNREAIHGILLCRDQQGATTSATGAKVLWYLVTTPLVQAAEQQVKEAWRRKPQVEILMDIQLRCSE